MRQKTPRLPALAGAGEAGNRERPGGCSDPNNTEPDGQQQDDPEAVPIAHTRIVFGCKWSFIYIEYCPLCGLEHIHGRYSLRGEYSDPLQAYEDGGHRAPHCGAHGLGHVVRRIGGESRLVERTPPPEYHEPPQGSSYRLVLGPKPACFTPRGIKNTDARDAMLRLARRVV